MTAILESCKEMELENLTKSVFENMLDVDKVNYNDKNHKLSANLDYISAIVPYDKGFLFVMNDKYHEKRVNIAFIGNNLEMKNKAYEFWDLLLGDKDKSRSFFDKYSGGSFLHCSKEGVDNILNEFSEDDRSDGISDDAYNLYEEVPVFSGSHEYVVGMKDSGRNGLFSVYIMDGIPEQTEILVTCEKEGDLLKRTLVGNPDYVSCLFERYSGKGIVPISKLVRESIDDPDLKYLNYQFRSYGLVDALIDNYQKM